MSEDAKNQPQLNPNKSALLISRDGTYHHNLTAISEKVGRITNITPHQAYIFLRRFANDTAGGQRYGINARIAKELGLKSKTSHIPNTLNNIYKNHPDPSQIRNRALRKDFKTGVLSKAHQAMLTLMFIKTVNPDVDMEAVRIECAEIFDHYLPDIAMIANGELEIVDSQEGNCDQEEEMENTQY